MRTLQPLPNPAAWCRCFDLIQVNEDEMSMMAGDAMGLAAIAFANGVVSLTVTLGSRGVVYFAAPGFEKLSDLKREGIRRVGGAVRTALVPAKKPRHPTPGDPTGCGDVWGATYFSRLLAGDMLGDAIRAAHRAAARNVEHRGASGLADHLRGKISVT